MRLSRPAFYSALGSCIAHSVALGFASTLIVSAPHLESRAIKVSLIQTARPLPVGADASSDQQVAAPVTPPRPMPSTPVTQAPPQPKPKPVIVKPKPLRPTPPKAIPTVTPQPKKPEPREETDQRSQPQSAAVQVAAISPSAASDLASATGAAPATGETAAVGRDFDRNTAGGTPGNGTRGGGGQGGSVVARPDYGVNPKPPYPMLARRLGAQGVVLLRVQVREDGSVGSVELERSSGFALLDESATRTVRERWRFVPARVDGAPVASWVEVPIRFVLEDS